MIYESIKQAVLKQSQNKLNDGQKDGDKSGNQPRHGDNGLRVDQLSPFIEVFYDHKGFDPQSVNSYGYSRDGNDETGLNP